MDQSTTHKTSAKKAAQNQIFHLDKTTNVFSKKSFRKEYEKLIKNIYNLSAFALTVYEYAQKKERIEENLVMLDAKDISKDFGLQKKEKIDKAIEELIVSGLLSLSKEDAIYCVENDTFFDETKYDEIKISIKVRRKETIQEEAAMGKFTSNPQQQNKINLTVENIDELKQFIKKEFSFTEDEMKQFKDTFLSKKITKSKFYTKIKEWQKAMPAKSNINQKKNYISACLLNEEWD